MMPEALNALDAVFVTMDAPNAPLHIGALIELTPPDAEPEDPQVVYDRIREHIEERLSGIAVLRRRVVRAPFDLGQPLLVDDPEFDLSFHIIRRAVPAPGSAAEVDALVARIMAVPLAPDRPLWELNVIEGLEDGRTALLIKIHHALADGVSGVAVFAGLFDLEPNPSRAGSASAPKSEPVEPIPSPLDMLARSSSELLRRPGAVLEALGSGLERLAGKVDELMGVVEGRPAWTKDVDVLAAPQTSLSGTISHARRFVRLRLGLAEVKEAAARGGGTVTDFAMAVTGGALMRLLGERGEAPEKDLVAFVPINIRHPGTEGQLGNRVSARLVPLDTHLVDPAERLAAVVERSTAHKSSEEPPTDMINELAEAAGPALSSLAGRVIDAFELFDHLPSGANVILSSVPGPSFPLYCAGERLTSVAPIGPLMFNQSMNITVLSYCEQLEFGILTCARRVPDADRFVELLADEAAALMAECELAAETALLAKPAAAASTESEAVITP